MLYRASCSTRWLSLEIAIERSLKQYPSLRSYLLSTQNAFDSTYNAQDSAHNATCNKTKVNKTIKKVVDSAHNAT